MTKTILFAATLLCVASFAARAETVQCPTTAAPGACAENQAIHDAFTAGSYIGPSPVFAQNVVDQRMYLGSDPDANVRLALRRWTLDGGGNGGNGNGGK